jgi:transposase
MARAYEDDLRRKFLSAYDRGAGTLEELAEDFGVSLGWAKKISAQRKRSGQAERVPHQPGRKWRAGTEAQRQVLSWVAAQPDLTLAEIQSKLAREAQVQLSRGRVWYLLRKLGLRLKKVAPRHPAGHRSQPKAPRGVPGNHPRDSAGTSDLSG